MEFYYSSGLDRLIFEEIRLCPFPLVSAGRCLGGEGPAVRGALATRCVSCARHPAPGASASPSRRPRQQTKCLQRAQGGNPATATRFQQAISRAYIICLIFFPLNEGNRGLPFSMKQRCDFPLPAHFITHGRCSKFCFKVEFLSDNLYQQSDAGTAWLSKSKILRYSPPNSFTYSFLRARSVRSCRQALVLCSY